IAILLAVIVSQMVEIKQGKQKSEHLNEISDKLICKNRILEDRMKNIQMFKYEKMYPNNDLAKIKPEEFREIIKKDFVYEIIKLDGIVNFSEQRDDLGSGTIIRMNAFFVVHTKPSTNNP